MVVKKLTFIERFIDEEPPEGLNHWRGIMAYCGELVLFHIDYFPKKHKLDDESCFIIRTSLFPHDLIFDDIIGKTFADKEEAKQETQRLFEKIINMFLIKND